MIARVVLALLVGPLASVAWPHARSVSYSSWEISERGARVELRVPRLDLTRFPGGGVDTAYFPASLELLRGDRPCELDGPVRAVPDEKGWAVVHWSVACPDEGEPSIRSRLLLDVAPSHVHFARVDLGGGRIVERILAESDPVWTLPDAEDSTTGLGRYVALGVEHILTGWDHLAFVAALLLLAKRLREVATLVTGFTLGHSVTLALAVTGLLRPVPHAVEALIGFSIALVAAENLWLLSGRDRGLAGAFVGLVLAGGAASVGGYGTVAPLAWLGLAVFAVGHFGLLGEDDPAPRLRAAVALAFGLVHGLGFAGILMEMELPANRLLPALFGFNVGVELGQLAFVAAIWPLLAWLESRRPGSRLRVAEAGSAIVLALGIAWTLR